MERDIFIISVYSLVVELMQIIEKTHKFRTKGFPPKLTDAEVITMEICGEFFKLSEDTEIYNYFKRHYLHYFPNSPNRTTFLLVNRLTCGKLNCYVNLYWCRRRINKTTRCNLLTRCRYRFAPTRAAVYGTKAFRPSRNSVIVPPKSWIITASNSV